MSVNIVLERTALRRCFELSTRAPNELAFCITRRESWLGAPAVLPRFLYRCTVSAVKVARTLSFRLSRYIYMKNKK